MMYLGYGYGFDHVLMSALWILLIVLVVSAIFRRERMWRMWGRHGWGPYGGEHGRALEILKERYAKGEIDRAEFEQKKKDLVG